jgi:hypothetical protein
MTNEQRRLTKMPHIGRPTSKPDFDRLLTNQV